ncbi:hypothetical protein B0H13DRAFT_2547937 [Mycena leptocephala]|nr:hypothetical protein B0H13DRAFT_2547937 [Mycena leptocephala]
MSDEPGARPVAQACAEATPTSDRRAPSAEYQPPPLRYRPPPPPPLPHSAFYQPISLPPPPVGYDPGIHHLMPAAPCPLTPVVEDLESGEPPIPSPAASDYNEDTLAKDIGGRPTKEQATKLLQFVQVVRKLALTFGQAANLHSDRFINAVVCSIPKKGTRGGNGWSTYKCFARSQQHALSNADLSAMYKKLQEAYPEGEAELILEKYAEWMLLEGEETLASRQRQFDRICNGLWVSIDIANEKDFEAIVLIVGASIHEDAELARVIATPSLETAFAESLKNSTTGLPLRRDHLLGVAKLCAYAGQLERSMGSVLMLPEALDALEALETTIMLDAEKLAKAAAATAAIAKASAELTKAATATTTVAKASTELTKASVVVTKASAPVAKVKKASPATLHPVHASATSTVTPTAGPSTITPTARPSTIAPTVGPSIADPVVIKNMMPNLNAMHDCFCNMSQACIGFDLFCDKGAWLGRNFLWIPLGATLAANDLRLLGYPTNTCLPSQSSSDKGSGVWRAQELTWFNVALVEHESNSGWGLRLEHHTYSDGDLVIIGHDYTFAAPQDPSATKEYWQTSRGKLVPCQDAEGNVWSACIDVRRAGDAGITKTFVRAKAKKKKKKATVKVEEGYDDNDEDRDEEDGETEEAAISSKAKGKSKAVEGRSKVVKVAKVPEVQTKSVAAKKTTVVAAKKTTAQAKKTTSAKWKAPSTDSSGFYEDEMLEEEEATSPPPAKKLRSVGPITLMPPPPPCTLQQPVQHMEPVPVPARNPGGKFKTTTKQVSSPPPPVAQPITLLSWQNSAVVSPNALPAFVADKWATKFMPMLHRALKDSDTPWELGVQNDYTLKTVQKITDNVCPGNTYTVKWNDPIVHRASQRLSERCSTVGTNTVEVVAKYIATNDTEYSTRQEIQAYARYALNRRRQALFKTPTPLKRLPVVDKRDPKYVKPKGLFESEFIIAVAAPLLKVGGSKFPYGAIGLAAAAVERAWYKHLASTEDAAKFSKEKTGAAVDGYVATAHKLSENAWQRIIDPCNEHTAQAMETIVDDIYLSLDGLREDLYQPSSP